MNRYNKNRDIDDNDYMYADEFDSSEMGNSSEEHVNEDIAVKGPLSIFPAARHVRPAAALFILFFLVSSLAGKYSLQHSLSVSNDDIFLRHEYWRLLTALFTHHDLLHLLSNGFLFILFGWMLRAYFGAILFPVASIAIGMVTNLIVSFLYDPGISVLGASGMVYGMVSLWIIFYIKYDIDRAIGMRIIRSIGFILVMLFPSAFDPQTSYLSHASGFLVGIAVGLLLYRRIAVRDPK